MTSLQSLAKSRCYSADSVSHRLQAAYGKILSPTFGVVSTSMRVRQDNNKSGAAFEYFASQHDIDIITGELKDCGLTWEDVRENADARTAFNIWAIQQLVGGKYKYTEANKVKKAKKLF